MQSLKIGVVQPGTLNELELSLDVCIDANEHQSTRFVVWNIAIVTDFRCSIRTPASNNSMSLSSFQRELWIITKSISGIGSTNMCTHGTSMPERVLGSIGKPIFVDRHRTCQWHAIKLTPDKLCCKSVYLNIILFHSACISNGGSKTLAHLDRAAEQPDNCHISPGSRMSLEVAPGAKYLSAMVSLPTQGLIEVCPILIGKPQKKLASLNHCRRQFCRAVSLLLVSSFNQWLRYAVTKTEVLTVVGKGISKHRSPQ